MTPIDRAIKNKGLKKIWVAKQVGISRNTLSLILKGESAPTLKVAIRLARLLDMTVEELWGYIADEDKKK